MFIHSWLYLSLSNGTYPTTVIEKMVYFHWLCEPCNLSLIIIIIGYKIAFARKGTLLFVKSTRNAHLNRNITSTFENEAYIEEPLS